MYSCGTPYEQLRTAEENRKRYRSSLSCTLFCSHSAPKHKSEENKRSTNNAFSLFYQQLTTHGQQLNVTSKCVHCIGDSRTKNGRKCLYQDILRHSHDVNFLFSLLIFTTHTSLSLSLFYFHNASPFLIRALPQPVNHTPL